MKIDSYLYISDFFAISMSQWTQRLTASPSSHQSSEEKAAAE